MRTQNDTIYEHLRKYRKISTFQAYRMYWITRLSARIYDLRKMGCKITTKTYSNKKSHWTVYEFEK